MKETMKEIGNLVKESMKVQFSETHEKVKKAKAKEKMQETMEKNRKVTGGMPPRWFRFSWPVWKTLALTTHALWSATKFGALTWGVVAGGMTIASLGVIPAILAIGLGTYLEYRFVDELGRNINRMFPNTTTDFKLKDALSTAIALGSESRQEKRAYREMKKNQRKRLNKIKAVQKTESLEKPKLTVQKDKEPKNNSSSNGLLDMSRFVPMEKKKAVQGFSEPVQGKFTAQEIMRIALERKQNNFTAEEILRIARENKIIADQNQTNMSQNESMGKKAGQSFSEHVQGRFTAEEILRIARQNEINKPAIEQNEVDVIQNEISTDQSEVLAARQKTTDLLRNILNSKISESVEDPIVGQPAEEKVTNFQPVMAAEMHPFEFSPIVSESTLAQPAEEKATDFQPVVVAEMHPFEYSPIVSEPALVQPAEEKPNISNLFINRELFISGYERNKGFSVRRSYSSIFIGLMEAPRQDPYLAEKSVQR